jgi:hypothetical protein
MVPTVGGIPSPMTGRTLKGAKHMTDVQRVRKVYPKAFCYEIRPGEFLIAAHNYGPLIGGGKTRKAAWREALGSVLGKYRYAKEFLK